MIRAYVDGTKAARVDFMHIDATLRLFEVNGERTQSPVHIASPGNSGRVNFRGYAWKPWQPRRPWIPASLPLAVARAKSFDEGDKVLLQSIAVRIINGLLRPQRQGSWQGGEG